MSKILLVLFVFNAVELNSNSIERAKKDPTVDDPRLPGTTVPIEEVNPAPAEPPGDNFSEKFRGTLLKKEIPSKEKGSRETKSL